MKYLLYINFNLIEPVEEHFSPQLDILNFERKDEVELVENSTDKCIVRFYTYPEGIKCSPYIVTYTKHLNTHLLNSKEELIQELNKHLGGTNYPEIYNAFNRLSLEQHEQLCSIYKSAAQKCDIEYNYRKHMVHLRMDILKQGIDVNRTAIKLNLERIHKDRLELEKAEKELQEL